MLELLEDIIDLFWWIAPFVFVFTLLRAVQETIRGGEKNVIYGVAAAVSHHLSRLLRTGAGRFCNFTGKCLRFLCSLEGFRGILYYYILRHQTHTRRLPSI